MKPDYLVAKRMSAVVALVEQGKTGSEIARELGISDGYVASLRFYAGVRALHGTALLSTVSDERLIALRREGLNSSAISKETGLSRRSVSARLKKIDEGGSTPSRAGAAMHKKRPLRPDDGRLSSREDALARRELVYALARIGWTKQRIAEHVGLSVSGVNAAIRKMRGASCAPR